MYRDSEIGVFFHHGVLARSAFPIRLAQIVSFLFSVAYAALGARFLLIYVQARPTQLGEWLAKGTDFLYVPLRAVIHNGHDRAGHPVAWALLAAIAAGAVVQLCLVSWLRRAARPRLDQG
jgi:hypothetical protein